ncbi:MAG: tRNA (cytidine/uridine-2'-O-)-methyltransferase [Saprospiraceae bacterium]
MFHIVLVEPEIPPNTGNLIRLAANTGCHLHLVEPLGFELDEKSLRRAGLDYGDLAQVSVWPNWQNLIAAAPFSRWVTLSTHHTQLYSDFQFQKGDALVFGSEGKGLADTIRENDQQAGKLTLPMKENNRSLNLSNTVSIVVYEAWRQCGFTTA